MIVISKVRLGDEERGLFGVALILAGWLGFGRLGRVKRVWLMWVGFLG